MSRVIAFLLVLALVGCTATAPTTSSSPCAVSEASYECQIERYSRAANM